LVPRGSDTSTSMASDMFTVEERGFGKAVDKVTRQSLHKYQGGQGGECRRIASTYVLVGSIHKWNLGKG
jgi:hypothetical protein